MAKTPSRKPPKACSMFADSNPTPKGYKYKPEFCQTVIDLARQGKSNVQIAVNLGVHKDTFYEWVKTYPEFSKAVKEAVHIAQNWWEDIAQQAVSGNIKTDAKIWSIMMKNKFGYRDNPHPEDQSTREGVVDEIARRVALIQEREKPI